MWSKVKRYAFILPLIVGFILRLIHLLAWKNTPFFHNPTVDEFYHYIWAKNIAEKRFELLSGPFFRAPFYPYFLGFLMWIFKEEFFYTRLIQIIIGSITICLVWNLARRVSGSSLVAFLSALIYAFYPIFIYFETRFLLDFLLLFFDTLALLLLLISLERLSYTLLYLSGFIIGVSGITRPNILAIAPILFIWWIINTRKRTNVSVKKALLYFLFILLPLLPVTIYNYYTSGEFIIVSTQGGINFYIGNNPYSDGASSYIQELGTDWQYIDCKHLAELETGKRLTHSELERFYLKKGIDFILNSPYKALKLYIRKLYLLLNKAEISDNQNIDFHRKYSWVLRIPMGYWILAPLGFSALFFARSRKQALLAVFVISYAITLLPFFITARLRLPILPPLIILAVNFFITTLKKASNNPIEFLKRYILFLFFLTICLTNWASINLKDFSHSYYTLGNIYLREGKLDDALESYGQAIKINPTIRNVHLNAGIVYLKLRKFDKAESEFKRELDTDPKSSKAYGNLSVLYMLKGDSEKALSHAKKSIELNKYYHDGYYILAKNLLSLGENDSALAVIQNGLKLFPDSRRLWFLYGVISEKMGKVFDAEIAYKNAIKSRDTELIPYYNITEIYREEFGGTIPYDKWLSGVKYNLGSLLAKNGRIDEGIKYLEESREENKGFGDVYLQLGTAYYWAGRFDDALKAYQKAKELGKDSAALRYNIALVYIKLSQFERAREELFAASQYDPNFTKAKELLNKLQ